jgi:hypothetical protein
VVKRQKENRKNRAIKGSGLAALRVKETFTTKPAKIAK